MYTRTATSRQEDEPDGSLETQKSMIRDYCFDHNIKIIGSYSDTGSGNDPQRPGFCELIQRCKSTDVDMVVCTSPDRIGRNQGIFQQLRVVLLKTGVSTIFTSLESQKESSASVALVEGLMVSMADYESQVRSEQTKAGMKAAKLRGNLVSTPPIGYLKPPPVERRLLPDPDTAPMIREAFEMYATGSVDQDSILEYLRKAGVRSPVSGKPISKRYLLRILSSPIYAGWVYVDEETEFVKGNFESIIDDDTFEAVKALLAKRKGKK